MPLGFTASCLESRTSTGTAASLLDANPRSLSYQYVLAFVRTLGARENERERERARATLGHPMLYSRAHPLRIRDGVALTSGPQGLPVALTPEQSKAKRERERATSPLYSQKTL